MRERSGARDERIAPISNATIKRHSLSRSAWTVHPIRCALQLVQSASRTVESAEFPQKPGPNRVFLVIWADPGGTLWRKKVTLSRLFLLRKRAGYGKRSLTKFAAHLAASIGRRSRQGTAAGERVTRFSAELEGTGLGRPSLVPAFEFQRSLAPSRICSMDARVQCPSLSTLGSRRGTACTEGPARVVSYEVRPLAHVSVSVAVKGTSKRPLRPSPFAGCRARSFLGRSLSSGSFPVVRSTTRVPKGLAEEGLTLCVEGRSCA